MSQKEVDAFFYMNFTEYIYVFNDMPDDLAELGEMLVEWDTLPEVSRVMNTSFYFYGTYRRDGQNAEMLKKGAVIKAYCEDDTWQYFRISKVKPTLETLSVTARPIAFDANNNFVENCFVDYGNGQTIMSAIQNNLTFDQKIKYSSTVSTFHQFTIKEAKPLEAIWGSNNGQQNLVGVTGGELDFDNYEIKLAERIGKDSGFSIDFGINLEAIESETDDESIVNSLYLVGGTEDNDYDEDKEPIKFKYLTLPGITDKNRRIGKRENSNCKTIEDLKKWGQSLFDKDRIHEPNSTHKISMTMLEYTEEYYELYQDLHKLHFGDTAHVYNEKYDEYFEQRMFEYVWYPTLKKYKSIVLGSAGKRYTAAVQTETQILNAKLENKTTMLVEAVRNASSWITGTKGGYVRFRPEKAPSEILIMDKPIASEARKVWRWNLGGLGYSSTGVDGEYGLAITQDGKINADFVLVGTIIAEVFESSFNAYGDVLKLVKGTLQVWNEKLKIMELTKQGLQFWNNNESVGLIGTKGDKFDGIALPDEDYNGRSLFITLDSGGQIIQLSALKQTGIQLDKSGNIVLKAKNGKNVSIEVGDFVAGKASFVGNVKMTSKLEVKELYVDGVKIDTNGGGSGGGSGGDGSTYEPQNINQNIIGNANIVAWLKKWTAEYGISEYIGLAYALIQVENASTDGTDDIMQSSESAGYPGPGYLTGEASVKQGCKHLADVLKSSFAKGVDVWGAMQSYNFGTAYVSWLASRGGKNTTDLAEIYSRDVVAPSLGNTTGATYSYINAVSQADGRTYLYVNGGNFHYAAMIRQYVKVTEGGGSGDYFLPIAKPITVTSEFGWRTSPITGEKELHNGIDLVNGNPNTPIYAAAAGEVVVAGSYPAWYGNYVVIKHSDGWYTGYAHQSVLKVSEGQNVTKGQQIGNMGTTGPSTGEHLHFQFFKNGPWPSNSDFVNPRTKMKF
ncbi:lysozyme family protein [Enterococcus dispar]|uniref:phage tail spike protein n=1 Tax=Enterococcus dispar TaxID=44009 RepID=UPI002330F59C|nr:phage tail spike protein [Enterococcus dispar]WCG33003.1 lysozyme family protein [Enterococcus dispar]